MKLQGAQKHLRVFAPAKINWYLAINRRRGDGFHDITTVFHALDWGDELVCRPLRGRVCRIECAAPGIPTDESNLVARAWRRLAGAYPKKVDGVRVRLIKRIPSGAGLGGGSSDAAAMLVAMRRMFDLPLSTAELEAHAAALGSDCAFFIRGGAALGEGRGEILTPLASRLAPLDLVVVWPGFGSPTAVAYRAIKPRHWARGLVDKGIAEALAHGKAAGLIESKHNIFHEVLTRGDSRYALLIERMESQGLRGAMLSGSGSAIVAHAEDRRHARRAAKELAQEYPVAQAVRTRKSGVRILPG